MWLVHDVTYSDDLMEAFDLNKENLQQNMDDSQAGGWGSQVNDLNAALLSTKVNKPHMFSPATQQLGVQAK